MLSGIITLRQQSLIDLAKHIIPMHVRKHSQKLLHNVISLTHTYGGDLNLLIPAALFLVPLMFRYTDSISKNKPSKHLQRIRNILSDIERGDGSYIEKIIKTITLNLNPLVEKHDVHEVNVLHDALISSLSEMMYVSKMSGNQSSFSLLHFIKQERQTRKLRV